MGKPSVKVTKSKDKSAQSGADLSETIQEEAQGLAEDKAKYKLAEPDGFTKLLVELFKLECDPAFKRDFTDPRWPRTDKGTNMVVERAYFIALRGPRKEEFGFRSLGADEINGDVKIIIDLIPKDVDEKTIMAKKWTAEQTLYRYFWMKKGEEFEDDKAIEIFLDRFAKLETKPEFTYGPVSTSGSLISNETTTQWIR